MNGLIKLSALAFAGIGGVALVQPERIPALYGGKAETPDARNEVRAAYGGTCLAMAALLVVRPSSAGTIGLITAGMAAGRAAGIAQENGEASDVTRYTLIGEAAIAAALILGRGQIAAGNAASAISSKAGDAASAVQSAVSR
jgi:hypothetical protein